MTYTKYKPHKYYPNNPHYPFEKAYTYCISSFIWLMLNQHLPKEDSPHILDTISNNELCHVRLVLSSELSLVSKELERRQVDKF
jgi:hypothetical protein